MALYANGMGGGLGRFLWPALERRGAVRLASTPGQGGVTCDLRRLRDVDGRCFAPGDIFVFSAAWSKPDQCRGDPEAAWRVNVENTCALIARALELGAVVLFFSSDTVYGRQEASLAEDAPMLAAEEYGRMKAEVERRFGNALGFTALRLSYVISPQDGVTAYFARCAREDAVAGAFGEYARSMVWIGDVRAVLAALIREAEEGRALPRAVNVGGPACLSRVEMARAYRDAIAPGLRIRDIPAPEGFFSARPRRIALDVSRLAALIGRAPLSPAEAYRQLNDCQGA